MMTNDMTTDLHNLDLRITSLENTSLSIKESLNRIENRFDKVDDRFDKIDLKFEKVDREIKEVHKELKGEIRSNFFWTLGVIGSVFAIVAHGLHWF